MLHTLEHVLMHAIEDNIRIIPFLFVTYCIMEYMEHAMSKKTEHAVKYSGKMGPLFGGILGIIPQCGFSAAAASFYSGGVITLGTLLAIFLSTSDEMLPILISETVPVMTIVKILGVKAVIGVIAGFLVDFGLKRIGKGHVVQKHIHDLCEQEHCHCEEEESSIWKSALIHTVKVFGFIFIVSVLLNLVLECGGESALELLANNNSFLAAILTGIVGLVPNCAASVIITQLYLKQFISAGAMMAGLLVGAGVGVLVLFRTNRPVQQNMKITGLLYAIGVAAGLLIDLVGITF
ncbi:MAG: arsenic efflux protein [Lachnospiraceae bacterium]|nr:arsenic efflux protein [Lachnospiraceae bacterium]